MTTPSPRRQRPVKVWDVIVTVVLLVLLAVLATFASFAGLFLSMASDPCGSGVVCNTGLIGIGVLVAVALPWLLFVVAVIASILLLVWRRVALWVPLVASGLIVAAWFLGAVIADAGVPT